MTIEKAEKAPFQETRRSRKARYARKEGRIGGRFVRVPIALLAGTFGPGVVAIVKAGAVRYVIVDDGGRMAAAREATGDRRLNHETIIIYRPGTGRIEAVRLLKQRLESRGGGYNRILFAQPEEPAH